MAKKTENKEPELCCVCGRGLRRNITDVTLSDGGQLCFDCVAKIRVMYPLSYGKKGKKRIARLDPIEELTKDTVERAMALAPVYLEDLRKKHGCNALFTVEDISMSSHGWFRAPYISAKGRCVFGFFDLGDEVEVLHRGVKTKAKILDIEREHLLEADHELWERRAEGGYPIKGMLFSQKDLVISPGDRIVKE